MKNIVLLCTQGMSTGMLMNKMRSAAKASNYECTISATSVSQAKSAAETADCILIGPQVRYELENVRKQCPNLPIEVIDMVAYGRLDGTKVLAAARKLMGD